MATDFTNKYMQVFQTYDEFGEHSADYVKGEDHVAFLIEENEVIYWLYLEQVWRPLNVRTTTTGQLEDGRTKVAVRLEYVEGGQKYTSVPNIPDPERITSMSRFLEDYPDIEEVNVSGTVNLTDLSYAFADSKIKDFSMLDTSNVTNIRGIIDNVNNKELDITIKYKTNYNEEQKNIFNNITLNKLELIQLENFNNTLRINDSNINKLILNNQRIALYGTNGSNIINEIESDNSVAISSSNGNSKGSEINNMTSNEIDISPSGLVDDNILNIKFHKLIIGDSNFNSYNWKNKIVCLSNDNICNIVFNFDSRQTYNFSFGYGIDYSLLPNANLAVKDDCIIGNFIFTVPIVNDEFYTKYSNADKISIFQYKTTFEEVADVNISNVVDSDLIYADWDSIDFDTSNMNIEIDNSIDIKLYKDMYFKTFTIHSNSDSNHFSIDRDNHNYKIADNLDISGTYILDSDLYYKDGIHDAIFLNYSLYIKNNVLVEKNIKANHVSIYFLGDSDSIFDIDTLIENNIVNNRISLNIGDINYDIYKDSFPIINYNSNINTIYLAGNFIALLWYNYITKPNIIHINEEYPFGYTDINLFYNTSNKNCSIYGYNDIDDIYLYFESNTYGLIPFRIYTYGSAERYDSFFNIKNIYGIINIYLNEYDASAQIININYIHIDINKVFTNLNSVTILPYTTCDEETTINLITKLVDNTSSSTKTIYMYRSQSNIIGEENIAAAVAKNYEFAIIEN